MYAKLVSRPDYVFSVAGQAGARLKDISDVITGTINSSNKGDLQTFEVATSTIVDTVPSGWTVHYNTPSFTFNHNVAATVIFTRVSEKNAMPKFLKLQHTATSTLIVPYTATNYTEAGVATNEVGDAAVPAFALSTIPVLYIKAIPGAILFYVPQDDANAATGEPEIFGVVERTLFEYDNVTSETPNVHFRLARDSARTVCRVPGLYNPALDTYTANGNLDVRFRAVNAFGTSPSITRLENGDIATPIIPLFIDNLVNGWVGGSLSEKSTLYRTANNLGRANDILEKSGKTYRVWAVNNQRYIVTEE